MNPSPLKTPAPPLPVRMGAEVRAFLSRPEGVAFVRVCVRKFGRSDAEVDDLVGEALVRCIASAEKYVERGQGVLGWIGTVARNTALTARRKSWNVERRECSGESDGEGMEGVIAREGKAALEVDPFLRAVIRRALAALPEGMREAWWRVDVRGEALAEVAQGMGVPVGTVMSRCFRAREHLRVALAREIR